MIKFIKNIGRKQKESNRLLNQFLKSKEQKVKSKKQELREDVILFVKDTIKKIEYYKKEYNLTKEDLK